MPRQISRFVRPPAAAAIGLATAAGLSGCLISSHSSSSVTGAYVGSSTFEQIEVGKTTGDWLLGALGEPTSRTCLADGAEVWKWSHTTTDESSGSVLFLFGGSSSHKETGATCVELQDGVVTKKWRD